MKKEYDTFGWEEIATFDVPLRLRQGYSLRRKTWNSEAYISEDVARRTIIVEDLLANDWVGLKPARVLLQSGQLFLDAVKYLDGVDGRIIRLPEWDKGRYIKEVKGTLVFQDDTPMKQLYGVDSDTWELWTYNLVDIYASAQVQQHDQDSRKKP